MDKTYEIDQKILAFNISSKELGFINITTPLLSFQTIPENIIYINNTRTLSFELDDYDESIPDFQILLQFFDETGGVF